MRHEQAMRKGHELGNHSSAREWPKLDGAMDIIASEAALAALAGALGADTVGELTEAEARLVSYPVDVTKPQLEALRRLIEQGADPLGDAFCSLRTAGARRKQGAVYTPHAIVKAMLDWAETIGVPDRIVDPGAGSGRFALEAGLRFPSAELIVVETDPMAALLARANLAVHGMQDRTVVIRKDFRAAKLNEIAGRTLYIGNPPYVRHHHIGSTWKKWLRNQANKLDLKASTLAGLHVYFFLAIARWAKAGDYGALITAAEWLDVNYGQLVRNLFLDRLGGNAVYVIEPEAEPFPGTQTTAAVTTFTVNGKPSSSRFARISRLDDLEHLTGGRRVCRARLEDEPRWTHFTRKQRTAPKGYVELGELCRVHRGQVTGANRVWIAGEHSEGLPEKVLYPTVTKARELIRAGLVLGDPSVLRRVIFLPEDISCFSQAELEAINRFLETALQMGARNSYTAQHRKPWWSVGLRDPAPVLATYMARRPPAFVVNAAQVRHLNIAHGLYPREEMPARLIMALVQYLRTAVTTYDGRMYAGGLTKFEPREMERIPVPGPDMLLEMV